MKKLFQQSLLLSFILLIATSCLDIQESLYLRNNGSGKFALTVDLNDMESLLQLLAKVSEDENAEKDIMKDVEVNFTDLKEKLEKQKGISQVKSIREDSNRLLGIAFEFDDINSLNRALKEINESEKTANTDYFSWKKGQLTRLNTLGIREHVQHEMETDIDIAIDGVMLGSILKDMTYTTKYTFEKPVKEVTNKNARLTNEDRTVSLTYHFFDQESTTNSLENSIIF